VSKLAGWRKTFIAAVDGGRELSGVRVDDTDRKTVLEVADELHSRATAMEEASPFGSAMVTGTAAGSAG
jgi:hypothetical protein